MKAKPFATIHLSADLMKPGDTCMARGIVSRNCLLGMVRMDVCTARALLGYSGAIHNRISRLFRYGGFPVARAGRPCHVSSRRQEVWLTA